MGAKKLPKITKKTAAAYIAELEEYMFGFAVWANKTYDHDPRYTVSTGPRKLRITKKNSAIIKIEFGPRLGGRNRINIIKMKRTKSGGYSSISRMNYSNNTLKSRYDNIVADLDGFLKNSRKITIGKAETLDETYLTDAETFIHHLINKAKSTNYLKYSRTFYVKCEPANPVLVAAVKDASFPIGYGAKITKFRSDLTKVTVGRRKIRSNQALNGGKFAGPVLLKVKPTIVGDGDLGDPKTNVWVKAKCHLHYPDKNLEIKFLEVDMDKKKFYSNGKPFEINNSESAVTLIQNILDKV
jgi:hypothetical protein